MKKQGVAFTVNSIYTVFVYSLMSWLIMDVLPIDVSLASPLAGEDLLLCAIFGGVISGVEISCSGEESLKALLKALEFTRRAISEQRCEYRD